MKFKNVKVGDKLLVEKKVYVGFGHGKSFLVYGNIEKVTPKQFTINGERYKKEDGRIIGEYFKCAYNQGDIFSNYPNEKVTDQTKEMEDYISLQELINSAHCSMHESKVNKGWSKSDLETIIKITAKYKGK